MKIGLWSTTAANNNSTPPDGFPEGMAPSTLNDAAREVMAAVRTYAQDAEWFDHGMSPTYIGANTFSVPGDQTGYLIANRQVKLYSGAAGTIYRAVATASFTTVTTVSLGAGTAITSSLSSFAIAALNPTNQSLPRRISASAVEVTGTMTAAAIVAVNTPKAWASVTISTGAVGAMTLRSSYNVSSVTRSAALSYRVNFTNAMADSQYCLIVNAHDLNNKSWGYNASLQAASAKVSFGPVSAGQSENGLIMNLTVYR